MRDVYRSSTGESQAFGSALLGPRDLENPKGIDQRKVVAGAHVGVRPPQRNLDTAYPYLGASERVQQCGLAGVVLNASAESVAHYY